MRKTLLVFLSLAMTLSMVAQKKKKEIGVVTSNFNSFGLNYKFGTSNAMWRLQSIYFNGVNREAESPYEHYDRENDEIKTKDMVEADDYYRFTFAFGREYRKPIVENLEIRYGADLSLSYSANKNYVDFQNKDVRNNFMSIEKSYEAGVNVIFGVNYYLTDKMLFGVELGPYIGYSKGLEEYGPEDDFEDEKRTSSSKGLSYNFSSSSILMTLAYQF